MATNSNGGETSRIPTSKFEENLRDLILSAFGNGAQIERTWEITTQLSDAPNWKVVIEKLPSDKSGSYEPEFIED